MAAPSLTCGVGMQNLSQTIAFHDVKQIVEQAGVADAVVAKLESVRFIVPAVRLFRLWR